MFGIFSSSRHGLSAAVPRPAAVCSRDATPACLRSRDEPPACLCSYACAAAAHTGGDGDDLTRPWEVEHGPVRLLQRHGHL